MKQKLHEGELNISLNTITFVVSPLYIKELEITIKGSKLRLRDFQYELLKSFSYRRNESEVILLDSPTGSGKTITLLAPLLANVEAGWVYPGAVGIYPSKELAGDQMVSIANFLIEKLNAKPIDIRNVFEELKPLTDEDSRVAADYVKTFEVEFGGEGIPVVLLYITSDSLRVLREILGKYVEGVKNNRDVLRFLWERTSGNAYRIVFTVPEYPYLAVTGTYREFVDAGTWLMMVMKKLQVLKALKSGDVERQRKWLRQLEASISRKGVFLEFYTSRSLLRDLIEVFMLFRAPVFFDEFHLYSGFTLASFLSLLFILLYERGVRKIIISSATPTKTVSVKGRNKDLLELVGSLASLMMYSFRVIRSSVSARPDGSYVQIRKRMAIKVVPVVLRGKAVCGAPAYGAMQRYVKEVLEDTNWFEDFKRMGRAMIILDRVASVLEVRDYVKERLGIDPLTVCSVADLLSGTSSPWRGFELREASLIVGNMAIAFGVDITGMDLGLVVAKDWLTAVQKIGRFGRGGGGGEALVYLPIPLCKCLELKGKLKALSGNEIPYISDGSGQSFIDLLRELYPKESPDILLRRRVGIFKVVLSVWVYVLATIIRLRDTIREKLHAAKRVGDVEYLSKFMSLLDVLGRFFEVKNMEMKLLKFIREDVALTPAGFYNLYSYRARAIVPVKRRVGKDVEVEEYVDITVAGRNLPLKYENGEFYVDDSSNKLHVYTDLWIGVYRYTQAKEVIQKLHGKVVTFTLVAELLRKGDAMLFQGERRIHGVASLLYNARLQQPHSQVLELCEAPVIVLSAERGGEKISDVIEYLSAVDSMIPIHVVRCRDERGELLGGLYLL